MSVAFRRESDEEHKEPRFELPIPPGPNLVTPRGLALIERRVAELEMAAAGELDAAAFEATKRDLRYWRTRLATARLVRAPRGGAVSFGVHVTFRLAGAERSVAIVGEDEADPAAGLIGFSAPVARAMMGAAAGDTVDFAGALDAIEIVSISPIEVA